MKRLLTIFTIVFLLLVPYRADAIFWRAFTALTGETAGSVDNVDCTDLGTGLDDGIGYVTTSGGDVYFYYFDRSATDATSSPDYIRCKNYTTSGVWNEATPASGSGVPTQADCSGITSGLCLDTDDGRLYAWDGDTVELVGVLDHQPLDADLTSLAALTTASYGRALLELADEAALQALITSPWADADVANNITIDLATLATTVTVTDNESTNEDNPIWFSPGGDPDGGSLGPETDGDFHYNPSTGILTVGGIEIPASGTPGWSFDDNTAATDGEVIIESKAVAGYESTIIIKVAQDAGGQTTSDAFKFDGNNEVNDSTYSITAPSIDAGILEEIFTDASTFDLQTNDSAICKKFYVLSSASVTADKTFILQNDALCDSTVDSNRDFLFTNYSATYDLIIDPDSTDSVRMDGDASACANGTITCDPNVTSTIRLISRNDDAWWAYNISGCDCTP